jgi:hypothetical protein
MRPLAAWFVTIAGAVSASLGLLLAVLLRSSIWDREQRELFRGMAGAGTTLDSSVFHTPQARSTMGDLRRSDPHLAAEAFKAIQEYERLETEPAKLTQVRKYAVFMSLAAYVVPALVLLGGIAVAGGVLWLRSL